jgi:hypothetical protein
MSHNGTLKYHLINSPYFLLHFYISFDFYLLAYVTFYPYLYSSSFTYFVRKNKLIKCLDWLAKIWTGCFLNTSCCCGIPSFSSYNLQAVPSLQRMFNIDLWYWYFVLWPTFETDILCVKAIPSFVKVIFPPYIKYSFVGNWRTRKQCHLWYEETKNCPKCFCFYV